MRVVLLCLWLVLVSAQQPSITVIPNPASCAYRNTSNAVFPSKGFIIIEISSVYSPLDSISVTRNSATDNIVIATSVYSNSKGDIQELVVTNSSHYSTLFYSITENNNLVASVLSQNQTCPKRVTITVSVPDSVHFICWNGQCQCNCAVKGGGVNIHFTNPQKGELDMLNAAGFGYTRMDFNWGAIEYAKGKYNWASYDVLVNSLAPYNITPYFIFDYSNSLYDNGTSPVDRIGDIAFANFAVNSTLNYAGRGIVWELYNEPNLGFWKPFPNVTQYVQLGLQVGSRLKSVTPREIFVGPAVANTGTGIDGLDVEFLQACFKGGLLEYWDSVSIHAYRQDNPETVVGELRQLRQLLRANMPTTKNFVGIISGEWGYSTSWGGINNDTQGKYIAREMLTNLGNEVPVSIWYDWHDDGTDPTNAEHNFGTTFNTYYPNRVPCYDPKPSYIARKTLQSQIGGKRFNKRLWVGNPDVWVQLYNTAGKDDFVIAAWTVNTKINSTILVPSTTGSTFLITSTYGTSSTSSVAVNGFLSVQVTTGPIYAASTSTNHLLSIIAATSRLLPDYLTDYGWFTFAWTVPNPLTTAITVGLNGTSLSTTLNSGDTAIFTQDIFVTRTTGYRDAVFTVTSSIGSFSLYSTVASYEPLEITILPATLNTIAVEIDNPSGTEFIGYIKFSTTGAHGQINVTEKLTMTSGNTSSLVTFPVKYANLTGRYQVSVSLLDTSQSVMLSAQNSYVMMDDYSRFSKGSTPSQFTVVNDGDPNVPANFTLVADTPSGGPANISALALHYYMGNGWKFLWVSPHENNQITTLPVAMGCWIYASNQKDYARVRIVDSTGQTFQFTYGQLSWNGWQYITFQFNSGFIYWGGKNDGNFHLPLKVSASFLLDSTQQANSGVVYFTPPVLIY